MRDSERERERERELEREREIVFTRLVRTPVGPRRLGSHVMRCLAVAHNVNDLVRPRAHGSLGAHRKALLPPHERSKINKKKYYFGNGGGDGRLGPAALRARRRPGRLPPGRAAWQSVRNRHHGAQGEGEAFAKQV